MIKVSIIIPVYNSQSSLDKTINSVQAQTLEEIQIILVNDGSTDNSLSICQEYAKKDNRIEVINKKNSGVSSARNVGIKKAKGKYIAFVDAGDWIEAEMYEKMYIAVKKTKSDVGICNYIIHRKRKKTPISLELDTLIQGNNIINSIIKNLISYPDLRANGAPMMGSVCRLLIDKNLINSYSLKFKEEIPFMEDLIFCIELFLKSKKVINTKAYFYHYILQANTASTSYRDDMFELRMEVFENIEQLFNNENLNLSLQNRLENRYVGSVINAISNEAHPGNKKSIFQKNKNIKLMCEDNRLKKIIFKKENQKYSIMRKITLKAVYYELSTFLYIQYYLINKIRH